MGKIKVKKKSEKVLGKGKELYFCSPFETK